MKKSLKINKLINSFNKTISVEGDKSLSIRWVLLSSLSKKKSVAYNLLKSEDVFSALHCVKKLGAKVKMSKDKCIIIGVGLNYKQKENLILNAGNSGTLGRLILGLLINYDNKIRIIEDDNSKIIDLRSKKIEFLNQQANDINQIRDDFFLGKNFDYSYSVIDLLFLRGPESGFLIRNFNKKN